VSTGIATIFSMRRRFALLFVLAAPVTLVATSHGAANPIHAAANPRIATCFWEGPISTRRPSTRGFDGRNFNFPEESATYWFARFNLPSGSHIELHGGYPHGRYMSLNAYSDGTPTDALSDIAIDPRPGSTNPFVNGARRSLPHRSWRVRVLAAAPPSDPSHRAANTIYAQPAAGASIEMLYRVYSPDAGYGLSGGVDLPHVTLVSADGTRATGDAACSAVNDPDRSIPVQTIAPAVWDAARAAPGCDAKTNPAYDPVRWERFFNLNYAQLAVVSDCTPEGRQARLAMGAQVQGGFYSNKDSAYIYAHLSRLFGHVLVVKGRLPRTPQTESGPKRMPGGQLRYWSLCTGESRVTTRTPDCVYDRQVLRRSGREYTIVVSRRQDRPANATAGCGVAWLNWGNRGDGAGDPNYGVLIMRNLLASPGFKHAIQRVTEPGTEKRVMGPYFPRSKYTSTKAFEKRGCKESPG
jgi:hypothetical protein